jgi:hypothetical protein
MCANRQQHEQHQQQQYRDNEEPHCTAASRQATCRRNQALQPGHCCAAHAALGNSYHARLLGGVALAALPQLLSQAACSQPRGWCSTLRVRASLLPQGEAAP